MSKTKTMQTVMKGATAEHKQRLRRVLSAETYDEVEQLARLVLAELPKGARIGSLQQGLLLAATAYAEYGVEAVVALVRETRAARRKGLRGVT